MQIAPCTRKFVLAAVALVLSAGISSADEAKKPSRVFGTITLANGTVSAGVQVKLTQKGAPKRVGGGGGGKRGSRSVVEPPTPVNLMANMATVTDAQGAFEFKAVAVGVYELEVGNPRTVGYASTMVSVDGSGNAMQQDLKLDEPVRE